MIEGGEFWVIVDRVTQRHTAKDFLASLEHIDKATPRELDLHLILDNSSTHKTADVQGFLTRNPRFHLHFTPTSASWLNAVESWFAQLERRSLYRGVFTSVAALRQELRRYIRVHNKHSAKPFVWTKSAEAIFDSVVRARQSTTELTR